MERVQPGKRRPARLSRKGGILHSPAPGQRRDRQAEGECSPDIRRYRGAGKDPVERSGHQAGLRGGIRPEAAGRAGEGNRRNGYGRGQGGVLRVPGGDQPGQPTDLLREPDRGIHRSQRHDEGSVRAAAAAVHGSGEHRRTVLNRPRRLERHPEGHRAGQRQRAGGIICSTTTAIKLWCAANNLCQKLKQFRKVGMDGLPDDFKSNPFIVVNDSISHATHLSPHDVGVFPIEAIFHGPGSQLANLKHVENACFLKHSIIHKVVMRDSRAIFQCMLNVSYDLPDDLIVLIIVHRLQLLCP